MEREAVVRHPLFFCVRIAQDPDQTEVTVHHRSIPAPILPDIHVPRHPMHATLYPARASAGYRVTCVGPVRLRIPADAYAWALTHDAPISA